MSDHHIQQQQQQQQHGNFASPPSLLRPAPLPAAAGGGMGHEQMLAAAAAEAAAVQHRMQQQHHQRLMAQPPPPMPPPPHQQQPDLLQLIHHAPVNAEALQRPEAHTLRAALDQGDATPNGLLQQFAHGNLPPLQREILLNVLKTQQSQGRLPTQLPGAQQHHQQQHQQQRQHQHQQQQQQQQQYQQHLAAQQAVSQNTTSPLQEQQHNLSSTLQQQQQRISPFGHDNGRGNSNNSSNNLAVSPTGGGPQRVPSPQELVYHAQQIMQNALIRRKLEEQKENYRRRVQDGVRDRSNSDPRRAAADSPMQMNSTTAFTPTAVMKKFAAERRDSDPRPQIPELRLNQMEAAGSAPGPEQAMLMPQQQAGDAMMPPVPLPPPNHHFMLPGQEQAAAVLQHAQALQQQMGYRGPRHAPPPEPRLMSTPPQMPHGMQASPTATGGGNLSQFFSPEVLAQAQSGNAPSMPPLPTQKALTLEEIERQAAAAAVRI